MFLWLAIKIVLSLWKCCEKKHNGYSSVEKTGKIKKLDIPGWGLLGWLYGSLLTIKFRGIGCSVLTEMLLPVVEISLVPVVDTEDSSSFSS